MSDDEMQQRDRRPSADPAAFPVEAHRKLRTSQKLSSWMIQREALLKFTTNHEIMRKKMVALTRSPRETRFLFHARDTALFYGEDMGFFPEDGAGQQAWKKTIDAQRLHERNQEARWDNALRYALSIMLGTRGHQINDRKPGHMVRVATEVLLRSSSENGLFPGKLDIVAKSPLDGVFRREEDAHSCYDASFEIPYIFLTHFDAIEAEILSKSFYPGPAKEDLSVNASFSVGPTLPSPTSLETVAAYQARNPQAQGNQKEDDDLREIVKTLAEVVNTLPLLAKSTPPSNFRRPDELSGDARPVLKKSMPLSNIIESHNVVEIEDEWLFNYPDFFGSEKDDHISIDDTLDSVDDLDARWLRIIDVVEMRRKYSPYDSEDDREDYESTVPSQGTSSASSYSNAPSSSQTSVEEGGPDDCGLHVLDIGSRKRLQRKGRKDVFHRIVGSFEYIWFEISRPRTVARAKKRVIVWERSDPKLELEAALLCYSASKGKEKADMLEFFERHFRCENFMFDHCNLAYNTWETEVHLSFFILEDASGPLTADAPLIAQRFPGLQGKRICRGSMGMRFYGDAFDRYWTLHMFSNVDPEETDERGGKVISALNTVNKDMQSSVQRKVLELHVIANMLSYVEAWTQMILAEVKSEIGIKSGAFSWSIPSMDTYSSWHRKWEGFAPLLQALADDLVSAQDIVGQWDAREGGRGQERPRWTHNDERKYRAAITRAQRVVDWHKKKIKDALNDVESLREACTTRLANAREELAFRSSQNIASFTYVTIVFLPLGFAASVFSMNGYPDAGWVASMTVIAVVTLAITTIALANAKMLLGVAEQVSKDARRFTGTVFRSSLIGQQQQQRRRGERVSDSPEPNESSNDDPKAGEPLDGRTIRHVLFWMAYLLIELPGKRVALACRELPASLKQTLGSPRPDDGPAGTGGVGSTDGDSEVLLSAASIFRKSMRIVGGVLLLPLLFISWTMQLLFYNILDILVFLGHLMRRTFYGLVTFGDSNGPATNTKVLKWLIDPPSSLRPMRNVMSRDEVGQDSLASTQSATSVESDQSDPDPREEV
ncbi:hypothetical protein KVR01_012707 [Diaporthe batatas]|uniref:uncharacterized protein n=1 Tax=Diaporthe batatas TaxID=748121 RepID=UPI001D04BA20|nr:uncharacterized protein KVR01_012707 [Diaporthe batatas]KAG8157323.1 hypothetical protein KVR01_012707 [Diaporthe batatas]